MLRNRSPSRQARAVFSALLGAPLEWRHGYELAKTAGISSGTLYPLLIRLHGREMLEARWEPPERPGKPPRHAYRLTAAGLRVARDLQTQATAPGRGREAMA